MHGDVTCAELFSAWHEELVLMRSVDHPVYSLNLFERRNGLLGNASIAKLVNFIRNNSADNLQMTVQVSEGAIMRSLLATVARAMPHDVYVVSSLQEAEAIINAHKDAHFQNIR